MKTFNIDKKFEQIGLTKVYEDEYIVQYEKTEKWGTRCLDLLHKASGNHLIQCYQKGAGEKGFARMVGITAKEAKLATKKIRQLGWKKTK